MDDLEREELEALRGLEKALREGFPNAWPWLPGVRMLLDGLDAIRARPRPGVVYLGDLPPGASVTVELDLRPKVRPQIERDHGAHLSYDDPYCPECGGNPYGVK